MSSSGPAVSVQGLSRAYRISAQRQRYRTLREEMVRLARHPLQREVTNTIWALRDVAFDVRQGETLGIIGANGAGKSTLLRILSRITEPTTGEVRMYGRTGSLLEVGAGFHPELTGRENVFLCGAIIGMKRREIQRQLEAIVAFAGIGEFLDTPVKRYSSGMYVRLAFSVTAHLNPDILIVDEVLTVGDAEFQTKSLAKMEELRRSDRTLLFVSHNMSAVTQLCSRVIVLDRGRLVFDGSPSDAIERYLNAGTASSALREWPELGTAPGDDVIRLRRVRVRTRDGRTCDAVDIRESVGLEVEFDVLQGGRVLVPGFEIFNASSICVCSLIDQDPEWRRRPRSAGHYVTTAWFPGNFFADGALLAGAAVSSMDPVSVHAYVQGAVAFHVFDSFEGDAARGDYPWTMFGIVRPLLEWQTSYAPAGAATSVAAS